MIFLICYLASFTSCHENALPADDLGPFYLGHEIADVTLEYPAVDGLVFDIDGPYIVYAGLTRLITPTNPDLGEPLGNVAITVYDMSQSVLVSTVSDEDGAFAFAIPLPGGPTDGYVEMVKEGFPVTRQFDRRFDENWTNMRLRMLDSILYDIPRQMLGQQDDRGYIQGSIYRKDTEVPIANVRIEASCGEVAYLKDGLPVPTKDIETTQSQGVFFVINCPPGPVMLRAYNDKELIAERTVLVWPKQVLTQVGIPVNTAK